MGWEVLRIRRWINTSWVLSEAEEVVWEWTTTTGRSAQRKRIYSFEVERRGVGEGGRSGRNERWKFLVGFTCKKLALLHLALDWSEPHLGCQALTPLLPPHYSRPRPCLFSSVITDGVRSKVIRSNRLHSSVSTGAKPFQVHINTSTHLLEGVSRYLPKSHTVTSISITFPNQFYYFQLLVAEQAIYTLNDT